MATKFAKDGAKIRKKVRESCEFIIDTLEKEHQEKISSLRWLLAEAKNGGGNSVSNTQELADAVWRMVAFKKWSRLQHAVLNDEFKLFEHFMNIKRQKLAIDNDLGPATPLCMCIGVDYRHEPRDYAEYLLDAGCDPNFEGPFGITPILGLLNEASQGDDKPQFYQDRMALLLRHGADPTKKLRIPALVGSLEIKAGTTCIEVCDQLIESADADYIASLEAIKTVMVAKAEEKILGDGLTAKTDAITRNPGI